MENNLTIKAARIEDVDAMLAFIFEHGPNQWNYLPRQSVAAHLADIEIHRTHAVLAMLDGALAGFASFMSSNAMTRYQPEQRQGNAHGYICEVVVHRDRAGQGIGAALLHAAITELATQGINEIYIERHEENLASAGMMRKAGFVEIDVYDDPERRASGSRRTSVCRLVL